MAHKVLEGSASLTHDLNVHYCLLKGVSAEAASNTAAAAFQDCISSLDICSPLAHDSVSHLPPTGHHTPAVETVWSSSDDHDFGINYAGSFLREQGHHLMGSAHKAIKGILHHTPTGPTIIPLHQLGSRLLVGKSLPLFPLHLHNFGMPFSDLVGLHVSDDARPPANAR
jgi:hypothetical protein